MSKKYFLKLSHMAPRKRHVSIYVRFWHEPYSTANMRVEYRCQI